ncbi:efflux RND transporter periplasmic adaptor subunit [Sulfurovum sp.]|uniref:efflux RND transporter periplasmic adaptor subunit n=1 Tax=Sulfurovum sp. TaxID=1969726 RepID=UPI0025DD40AA|nr:efflux RND transporter periplasmic adaptor subunit [Sulfurovum sp.]
MLQKRTILLSIISLLFLYGCGSTDKTKQSDIEEKPLAVKVHTLKKEVYPIWGTFTGKTQAVDEVMVLSRVEGELKERLFNPGDMVKKDQILFVIDKREYQAAVDQKKAILEKDRASLKLANANVKRYRPLVKEQLAPREKLDELVATQKQLEAMIRADEAALEAAELDLSYCDVKASIDGQIGKEMVLAGNIVKPGTELAKIVNAEYLYVNFNPSAEEIAVIQKYKSQTNPSVKVYLRSGKKTKIVLEGKIEFIDSVSNASTGTVPVRAKVHNPDRVIFPGSFVIIDVLISDKMPVVAVDPDQVYQNQQGEYVYVVDANNTIEVMQIHPVFSTNDMVILPKEFIGKRVLAETIRAITPGVKVTPIEVNNTVTVSE